MENEGKDYVATFKSELPEKIIALVLGIASFGTLFSVFYRKVCKIFGIENHTEAVFTIFATLYFSLPILAFGLIYLRKLNFSHQTNLRERKKAIRIVILFGILLLSSCLLLFLPDFILSSSHYLIASLVLSSLLIALIVRIFPSRSIINKFIFEFVLLLCIALVVLLSVNTFYPPSFKKTIGRGSREEISNKFNSNLASIKSTNDFVNDIELLKLNNSWRDLGLSVDPVSYRIKADLISLPKLADSVQCLDSMILALVNKSHTYESISDGLISSADYNQDILDSNAAKSFLSIVNDVRNKGFLVLVAFLAFITILYVQISKNETDNNRKDEKIIVSYFIYITLALLIPLFQEMDFKMYNLKDPYWMIKSSHWYFPSGIRQVFESNENKSFIDNSVYTDNSIKINFDKQKDTTNLSKDLVLIKKNLELLKDSIQNLNNKISALDSGTKIRILDSKNQISNQMKAEFIKSNNKSDLINRFLRTWHTHFPEIPKDSLKSYN